MGTVVHQRKASEGKKRKKSIETGTGVLLKLLTGKRTTTFGQADSNSFNTFF